MTTTLCCRWWQIGSTTGCRNYDGGILFIILIICFTAARQNDLLVVPKWRCARTRNLISTWKASSLLCSNYSVVLGGPTSTYLKTLWLWGRADEHEDLLVVHYEGKNATTTTRERKQQRFWGLQFQKQTSPSPQRRTQSKDRCFDDKSTSSFICSSNSGSCLRRFWLNIFIFFSLALIFLNELKKILSWQNLKKSLKWDGPALALTTVWPLGWKRSFRQSKQLEQLSPTSEREWILCRFWKTERIHRKHLSLIYVYGAIILKSNRWNNFVRLCTILTTQVLRIVFEQKIKLWDEQESISINSHNRRSYSAYELT